MKIHHAAAIVAALSVLGGCGGNDAADQGEPPQGATSYAEVTPTLGSLDTFQTVSIDDSGNSVVQAYEERVTAVGADGSYQLTQDDPLNQTATVNGITYRYDPTVRQYGPTAANNVQSGYTVTLPSGGTATCTMTIQSGVHTKPMYVGQTWSTRYTVTCGSATTAYLNTGTVAAVESVTVPAGTFTTLKEIYSSSWTTAAGQQIVEHSILWMDPAHGFFTVKRASTYERSGNVPLHHVDQQTVELQSRH